MKHFNWILGAAVLSLALGAPRVFAQEANPVVLQEQMAQQVRIPDTLYRMQFQAQSVATLQSLGLPVPQQVADGVTLQALALSDRNLVDTFGLADVNAYRNQYHTFSPAIGQTVLEQQDNYAQTLGLAREAYIRSHIKPWNPSNTNLSQDEWVAQQMRTLVLPPNLQDDPLVPTYQKQAVLNATGGR